MKTTASPTKSLFLDRYEIVQDISFDGPCRIIKCFDTLSNATVALKCINSRHPGHYPNQNIQQCRGVLIADMLQRQSKFFPKINEISYRKVPFSTAYTYVINMECLDLTLADAISQRLLTYKDKIRIFYRLIKAVTELGDAGVVHTNLTPRHILLSEDLETIKICGFGNAKLLSDVFDRYTLSFAKKHERIYKPLELLLYTFPGYQEPQPSNSMDVWSLGTIFAEMMRGYSLFVNAHDTFEDYIKIWSTLGYPTREESLGLKATYHVTVAERSVGQALRKLWPTDKTVVPWLKIVDAMLHYHPQQRVSIRELLNHDLFTKHFEKFMPTSAEYMTNQTAKMEQIQINLPADLHLWKPDEFKLYFDILIDTIKSVKLSCNGTDRS